MARNIARNIACCQGPISDLLSLGCISPIKEFTKMALFYVPLILKKITSTVVS